MLLAGISFVSIPVMNSFLTIQTAALAVSYMGPGSAAAAEILHNWTLETFNFLCKRILNFNLGTGGHFQIKHKSSSKFFSMWSGT